MLQKFLHSNNQFDNQFECPYIIILMIQTNLFLDKVLDT